MPATIYHCERCGEKITLHIKPSEPPMHPCGGSSHKDKWLPLTPVVKQHKKPYADNKENPNGEATTQTG